MSEFVMLLANGWTDHLSEVEFMLEQVGAEMSLADEDTGVVEGVVESVQVSKLAQLPCAGHVTEGTTYIVNAREALQIEAAETEAELSPRLRVRPPGVRPSRRQREWRQGRRQLERCRRPHSPRSRHRAPFFPLRHIARSRVQIHFSAKPESQLASSNRFVNEYFPEDDFQPPLHELVVPVFPNDAPCTKAQGNPAAPLRVRLAYLLVAACAGASVGLAATRLELDTTAAVIQLLCGVVLLCLAISTAAGLCRRRFVRCFCCILGLSITLAPLLLGDSVSFAAVVLGLVAFFSAAGASEMMQRLATARRFSQFRRELP